MNEPNELGETQTTANSPKRRAIDFTGHVLRILAVFSALAVVALFTGCLLMLQIGQGHWLVKQDHLHVSLVNARIVELHSRQILEHDGMNLRFQVPGLHQGVAVGNALRLF